VTETKYSNPWHIDCHHEASSNKIHMPSLGGLEFLTEFDNQPEVSEEEVIAAMLSL
jgi:hypothetical protein